MLRTLRVTVDGHEYQVTVEDLTDAGTQFYPQPGSMVTPTASGAPAPAPAPSSSGPPAQPASTSAQVHPTLATGAVLAPMSGVLVEILVKQGQEVSDGETVAVIEAMKMKTPIVVDHGGTIATIDAAVDDGVQVGQTIMTIT